MRLRVPAWRPRRAIGKPASSSQRLEGTGTAAWGSSWPPGISGPDIGCRVEGSPPPPPPPPPKVLIGSLPDIISAYVPVPDVPPPMLVRPPSGPYDDRGLLISTPPPMVLQPPDSTEAIGPRSPGRPVQIPASGSAMARSPLCAESAFDALVPAARRSESRGLEWLAKGVLTSSSADFEFAGPHELATWLLGACATRPGTLRGLTVALAIRLLGVGFPVVDCGPALAASDRVPVPAVTFDLGAGVSARADFAVGLGGTPAPGLRAAAGLMDFGATGSQSEVLPAAMAAPVLRPAAARQQANTG